MGVGVHDAPVAGIWNERFDAWEKKAKKGCTAAVNAPPLHCTFFLPSSTALHFAPVRHPAPAAAAAADACSCSGPCIFAVGHALSVAQRGRDTQTAVVLSDGRAGPARQGGNAFAENMVGTCWQFVLGDVAGRTAPLAASRPLS
ncbi:MAG: hypothetical protein M1823_000704 [Watsoniomyces obsoletus]|nr:MAG: hypothetical protein M1823_000704 [Watsoniomyces obsoletus]